MKITAQSGTQTFNNIAKTPDGGTSVQVIGSITFPKPFYKAPKVTCRVNSCSVTYNTSTAAQYCSIAVKDVSLNGFSFVFTYNAPIGWNQGASINPTIGWTANIQE